MLHLCHIHVICTGSNIYELVDYQRKDELGSNREEMT